MLKRILSFLLCLVMVLSVAAPTVMAAESDDIYVSDGSMDNVVFGDNVTFENVNIKNDKNDKVDITTPGGAFGSTGTPGVNTDSVTPEYEASDVICDCSQCDTLADHKENCSEKTKYQNIATGVALDVFAQWGQYTHAEQAYMLEFLRSNYPTKYEDLVALLEAPRGSDSQELADGTIVNVDRIPNDGSVTVQDATDKMQSIVDEFVAKNEGSATELFSYDVSVQDGKGADWQPEATVHMELEMPGVKLHKYSVVYVVHVDDAGNATKIPAQVTEDGKIAFETDGFSTFAGFTVDFDYEGNQFAINGKTSILLSELFEELKVPHDVEEVSNVVFSDTSLVTVEKEDNDWLLTSLRAFDTKEKLDITLKDGSVFTIKVTDAAVKVKISDGGTWHTPTDGVINWYADGDGELSNGWKNGWYWDYSDFWSQDYTIYFTGAGTLTINICPGTYAAGTDLKVNIAQLYIDGGANVEIKMPTTSPDDYKTTWTGKTLTIQNQIDDRTMFQVHNGSLKIDGQNDNKMIIDGKGSGAAAATNNPIIRLNDTADNLTVTDVIFRDGKEGAIRCRANNLQKFIVKRCTFEKTIKRTGNGGAIYIMSNTADSKGDYVAIHDFQVVDCEFNTNSATESGGAMCLMGYIHHGVIAGCTFTGCSAGKIGGAIDVCGNIGSLEIRDSQNKQIKFENCTAGNRGGAVAIRSTDIKNNKDVVRWTRSNLVTIKGCEFTNCDADSHGGAIAVLGQIHTLNVSSCAFKNCDTKMNGGGISIDSADLPAKFKGSASDDPDWCAGIDTCDTCTTNNHTFGTVLGNQFNWGTAEKPDYKSWINTVSIDSSCSFSNCTATGTITTDANGKKSMSGGNGGAIEFASGCFIRISATIDGATIDGCKTNGEGNAIFWSSCCIKDMQLKNSYIKNCVYSDGSSPGVGGTVKTTGNTCIKLTVNTCEFLNNESLTNGGGLYWNSAKKVDGLTPSAEVNNCLFDGNFAKEYGGGIFVESNITVIKCHIKNNEAGNLGGGIAQQVYNNASARMLTSGEETNLKLDPNTWVHHNTAKHGGGISVRANASKSIDNSTAITYKVRFELNGAAVYQNTAKNNGGGIYFIAETYDDAGDQAEVDRYTKKILINAGTGTTAAVYKNTAGNNGGGIFMKSSQNTTLQISGGYISGNKADCDENGVSDGAGNGGGIYMTGKNATCKVTGGIIGGEGKDTAGDPLANTAICGGGIAIAGGAKIEMEGGEISYNNVGTTATANRQGGGIWLAPKDGDVANTMILSGGNVKYNSTPGGGGSDGGGIYVGTANSFTFNNGTIDNNSCGDAWGGGLRIAGGCTVNLTGGTISNNKAGAGAGLLVYGVTDKLVDGVNKSYVDTSTLNMSTGCIVTGNTAGVNGGTGNGGGMYLGYCNATFDGGQITGNTAGNMGGGFAADHSTVTIYDAEISGNNAKLGGGISASSTSTTVKVTVKTGVAADGATTAKITQNTATSSGGGMYAITGAKVTVEAGSVTYNKSYDANTKSWGTGGGIHADNATVSVTSTSAASGVISHNEGSNGGGIYAISGADVTVTDGYVTYNKAHGTPTDLNTAYQKMGSLRGTGGGVFIARGTESNTSTFTLNGDTYAIYGNLADFAADDVFANGQYTTLTIPKVTQMDLTDYDFNPEAWFEDYPKNDSAYTSGLNLAPSGTGITNNSVYRYRGSDALQRVMINDNVVDTTVNVAGKYVCMTLGMPAAINDTIVIDYGKPVDINVLQNEIMNVGNATLMGIGELFKHEEDKYAYPDHNTGYGESYTTPFGTAVAKDGVVTFTLNSLSMDKQATFSYEVKYTNSKDDSNNNQYFYYYADVTVIPATSIYYEDGFGSITYTGNWETITDGNTGSNVQDEDRPGKALQTTIDNDNVYGYDSSYKSNDKYSMGSAHKATVSGGSPATAEFTFKGTGFDVISLTNSTTGVIVVMVSDKDGNSIVNYLVDTYYGYKYENGKWTPSASGDHLYQVPVIKIDMNKVAIKDAQGNDTSSYYGYGEYKVKIVASYGEIFDHTGSGSYSFFLDAVRIYNPANNGQGNPTIENAYKDDNEGWPSYYEVRNMLIEKGAFNGGVSSVSGAVFIDGSETPSVDDYKNFGPNNEVYLSKDQSIAFKLNVAALKLPEGVKIASVQIGLRTLGSADSCTYKIYNPETSVDDVTAKEITTATDMFYNITDLCYDAKAGTGKNVVITCTGTNMGLCITNLKITFTGNPGTTVSDIMPIGMDGADILNVLASLSAEVSTPVLTPEYPTLSLDGEVRYNITFSAENLGALTADRMGIAVFNSKNVAGTVESADDVVFGAVEKDDMFTVSTHGIPAKNLGDTMYFKLFIQLEDGSYVYSDLYHYSARTYAKRALANGTPDLQALAVALMNYGAEAQKYFDYKTDDLMNKDITAEQQALLAGFSEDSLDDIKPVDPAKRGEFVSNGGFTAKYPSITTGGAFEINYYFAPEFAVDGNMTLYCWSEETYNNTAELTAENADSVMTMNVVDGMYVGKSQQIFAKDLDKTVYAAAVYESNGVVYCSGVLSYSVTEFCNNNADGLSNAIAIYGCATQAFFAE